jgi:hypothetical protein
MCSVLAQERGQDHSMMIASVVEHEDHAAASCSIALPLREEALEGCGIEHLADPAPELACAQIDRAKAGDGLAGGSMEQNRVPILRGRPHATARAVLLKVTFVQAPQLNVAAPGQASEFFLPPPSHSVAGMPKSRGVLRRSPWSLRQRRGAS